MGKLDNYLHELFEWISPFCLARDNFYLIPLEGELFLYKFFPPFLRRAFCVILFLFNIHSHF